MDYLLRRKVYEALPGWLKSGAVLVPFGWIAGRVYRETLARGPQFARASREEILAYQEKKLGEMLQFAVNQVPAYQHLRGAVDRFRPFDALKEFPLLSKETLQEDMLRYLPREFDKIPHYETTTGGTSGSQLRFYLDDVSQSIEIAFMHRQWQRVGYTPECRKATFRGVSFRRRDPGAFWQPNPIYNEVLFSPFHMSEKNLGAYVERIARFKPEYFHGYPSAIDILAEYVMRNGLQGRLPPIRAVLLGSEGCTPGQRERIEGAFGTRVFSWYGHSERLVLAGECEKTCEYHHFPDYGILEIISEEGAPCDKEGERGEIVGSGLLNRSLPLIRYRTGDLATRCEPQCACGRCWDRFRDVEGRWQQDMVIGREGTKISVAALNMHGPLFERVVRYQYFQDTPGKCVIRVMAAPGFTEADRKAIEKAYQDKVGGELEMPVQIVNDIALTARGKLKFLDSRLGKQSDATSQREDSGQETILAPGRERDAAPSLKEEGAGVQVAGQARATQEKRPGTTWLQRGRIAIIHGNDGTDVRIGKVCRSLSRMGYDAHFIGWDRRPKERKNPDLGLTQTHILSLQTQFGRATVLTTLRFWLHVCVHLARLRPEIVCCVNEEHAFLVLPLRRIFFRHLVCDVFDALVDRHSEAIWLYRIAFRIVSFLSRSRADRLIATDQQRFERFGPYRKKCFVIENFPEDPGPELSRAKVEGPIKIYVGGSLFKQRGLEQVLDVADQLGDLEIVSAGWLLDAYARDIFVKHARVKHHGIVTARRSLELAAQCDAVLAFYEPVSLNNRMASPNKVYDAMSVGRPVIINLAAGVSQWIVDNQLGMRCRYNDLESLKKIVRSLPARRENLAERAAAARKLLSNGYTWERMEERLKALYFGLAAPPGQG